MHSPSTHAVHAPAHTSTLFWLLFHAASPPPLLSPRQAELLAELEGELFDLRDQLAQAAGEGDMGGRVIGVRGREDDRQQQQAAQGELAALKPDTVAFVLLHSSFLSSWVHTFARPQQL